MIPPFLSLSASALRTLRSVRCVAPSRILSTSLVLAISLFAMLVVSRPGASAQGAGELIKNGGFEGGGGSDGQGAGIPRWTGWSLGYEVDRTVFHQGEQSARCDAVRAGVEHGAVIDVVLNQKRAAPITISGWSRSDKVDGVKDNDYAIYVDLEYMDGTPLYGQTAPFRTGTHNWERRSILITPTKPVKRMNVIALFRKHTGTVWFDDFSANQMEGAGIFDGQPLLPMAPRRAATESGGGGQVVKGSDGLSLSLDANGSIVAVRTGADKINPATAGGFWVRDVAAGTAPAAMLGPVAPRPSGGVGFDAVSDPLQLKFTGRFRPDATTGAIAVDGDVYDTSNTDRAVTVYFALPVNADGWSWGEDIRAAEKIRPDAEYSNLVHVNVGAIGAISLYPVGAVSNSTTGVAIANQIEMPSVYRIFYNGPTRQLVIAWDFALTGKTSSWPKHQAHFHANLFWLPPDVASWGFRAAMQRFYKLSSPAYDRLAKADGIWVPFVAPEKVKNYKDFGFAYHEGDNSKKADNAAGILNFRYTEPMSWWMPMPPEMPRTYENALKMVHELAAKKETILPNTPRPTPTELAKAVLNSGSQDETGKFNLEFRNEPWGNGAVFILNPNPEMAAGEDRPTRGYLNYNPALAKTMYGPEGSRANGVQDGEYLDSLESWSDVLDFRPENLGACPYPLTFETDSRMTTMPQWFSTHTFTRYLRDDLHNRGKLLMANSTPIKYSIFSSVLDIMGIEVNWLGSKGQFEPETDSVMNMRRTLSGTKPYLLLMNTDYDKFTHQMVEEYLRISMFYGIFPSMFSANAAEHVYWDSPALYERDRALFVKYIPIIKRLSAAGWEPITYAAGSSPDLYVERYGSRLFTVRNATDKQLDATLLLNAKALKLPASGANATDLTTGIALKSHAAADGPGFYLSLKPGESIAIEVK